MTSAIVSIYDAIEALTVNVNGNAPIVYGLTGIPNTIPSANMPCRILLDLANAGEGQSMEFFTVNSGISGGGAQYIDWQLSDLMLLKPQPQGIGVKEVATALITYTGAYIDTARNSRTLVNTATNEAMITGLKVTPGIYEYPAGGGVFYWGVMCNLTIREIII